jgi:FkbM family methyltransferase
VVEIVEATLNGRYTLKLPKHRADRPEWYTEAGWEKARMEALVDCIEYKYESSDANDPLPVVYYVGSEEGELAAICAMSCADVYLFEPNPKAWPNIKAVWDANKLTQPWCFPGFASDKTVIQDGTYIGRRWPESATGEIVGDHGFKELYLEADNYSQIRLDDVSAAYEPPDILTFDVEGSEWQVLRGAHAILEHARPVIFASIHPEFMFHQWGEYSADFRGWIKAFGYKETILDYQHELHCMYEPL